MLADEGLVEELKKVQVHLPKHFHVIDQKKDWRGEKGYIYILLLEGGKWYIGFTTKLKERISRHFRSGGSTWTRKYSPVAIAGIYRGRKYKERDYTIAVAKKYGSKNVRGHCWTRTDKEYTSFPINEIVRDMDGDRIVF